MRAFATCIVALGLIAMPAIAREGGAGDKNTTAANTSNNAAANSTASSASTADSKADSPAKAEASSMEIEIDQLRDLVESQAKALQEQQLKMAALEKKLNGWVGGWRKLLGVAGNRTGSRCSRCSSLRQW